MRRSDRPAHPTSTQQILELREQGRTWSEIAEQVDMTVSGAWSRYRRARPPQPSRLGRWQQVLADALDRTLPLASVQRSLIISVAFQPELNSLLHGEQRTVSPRSVVPLCCTWCGWRRQPGRPELSGAGEAERDHERHPAPRASGGRKRRHRRKRPTTTRRRSQPQALPPRCGQLPACCSAADRCIDGRGYPSVLDHCRSMRLWKGKNMNRRLGVNAVRSPTRNVAADRVANFRSTAENRGYERRSSAAGSGRTGR